MRPLLTASRTRLFASAIALLPTIALADGADFLQRSNVAEAREGMADVMDQLVTLITTTPDIKPIDRAFLMTQVGSTVAEALVGWEAELEGDAVGDTFLSEGMTVVTCLGLASFAEVDAQVDVLRVAAGYWRMSAPGTIPEDLC